VVVIAAALAAAIFAIHPVVVEPVAWVPGREELLMTFFALLCLHFHRSAHLATKTGIGLGYHALAAVACAAAAMSNVVGAAVPLLVLAYDAAVARPKGRRAIIAAAAGALPLWAIGIGAIIIRVISESHPMAVAAAQMAASVGQLPWQHRLAIILDGLRLNLLLLVWPTNLTPFYPRSGPESVLSLGPMIGLALGLATLAALWLLRRERTALLGILWFLLALAPTSQIIPHHIFRADRFLYLPLAGLVLAAGAGLAYLAARSRAARVAAGLSLVIVAALAVVTIRQVPLWKDGLTIFSHAALVTPDNTDARHALGAALSQAGRTDEAIAEYREAIRLDPASAVALHSLGCSLTTRGDAAGAIRAFENALRVGPDSTETRNSLGVAWLAMGNIDEAVRQYREALRLQPDNADAWNNLGVAAYRKGDVPEAVRCFIEAVRLNPRLGHVDEAEQSLRKAIEVDPRFAEAYDTLGLVLVRRGNFAGAAAQFEQAVRLSPGDYRPMKHLARLLATCPEGPLRSGARSVALAEQAWRMTGSRDRDCLDTLAAAYAEAGRFDEAVTAAQKVVAMAEETRRPELVEIARKRLALYQSRMPLREEPPR
jgi:Flp pilus assembly protein TadD